MAAGQIPVLAGRPAGVADRRLGAGVKNPLLRLGGTVILRVGAARFGRRTARPHARPAAPARFYCEDIAREAVLEQRYSEHALRPLFRYGIPLRRAPLLIDLELAHEFIRAQAAYTGHLGGGGDFVALCRQIVAQSMMRLRSGKWVACGLGLHSGNAWCPIDPLAWRNASDASIGDWLKGRLTLAGLQYHEIHIRPLDALPFADASLVFGYETLVDGFLVERARRNEGDASRLRRQLNSELLLFICCGYVDAHGFDATAGQRRMISIEDLEDEPRRVAGSEIELASGTVLRDVQVTFPDPFKAEAKAKSDVPVPPVLLSNEPSRVHIESLSEGVTELFRKPDDTTRGAPLPTSRKGRSGAREKYDWPALVSELIRRGEKGEFRNRNGVPTGQIRQWFENKYKMQPGQILPERLTDLVPNVISSLGYFGPCDDVQCPPGEIVGDERWPFWRELIGFAISGSSMPSLEELVPHMLSFCVHVRKFRPDRQHVRDQIDAALP